MAATKPKPPDPTGQPQIGGSGQQVSPTAGMVPSSR
jgi:hypothetical protein